VIERAAIDQGQAALQNRLHQVPARIRQAIDRARLRRGLPALVDARDRDRDRDRTADFTDPGACGVWIDPASRIAPKGKPPARGMWPATALPRLVTRAVIIAHGGDAPAWATGEPTAERIMPGAFGTTAELNRSPGWSLRVGHDTKAGPALSYAGAKGCTRLRAIDCRAGWLAVDWIPDMSRPDHLEALRMIEAGAEPSVAFLPDRRQQANGRSVVTKGTLLHIALVREGCYPGAKCAVFRDRPDGAAELQRQLDIVLDAAFRAAARE
jgi:hypothetical protein